MEACHRAGVIIPCVSRSRQGLPRAGVVEIDPRKCPPDPLAFFANRAIFRGLGGSVEPALDSAHMEGMRLSIFRRLVVCDDRKLIALGADGDR